MGLRLLWGSSGAWLPSWELAVATCVGLSLWMLRVRGERRGRGWRVELLEVVGKEWRGDEGEVL